MFQAVKRYWILQNCIYPSSSCTKLRWEIMAPRLPRPASRPDLWNGHFIMCADKALKLWEGRGAQIPSQSARKQEAHLMLINPRDAFRGQSRSPNIVPFHIMSGTVSC